MRIFKKKKKKKVDQPLGVAVVGLGYISQVHINAIRQSRHSKLIALCDTNQDLLIEKANKLDIDRFYSSFDQLLHQSDIEVIDILTPHYLHVELIIKALHAGKTVICEKPLATNLKQLQKIEKLPLELKNKIYLKHYFRYAQLHHRAKEMIEHNDIGTPYFAHLTYTTNDIDQFNNKNSWKFNKKLSGGGVWFDNGIHALDLLVDMFGLPLSITATCEQQLVENAVKGETLAVANLKFANNFIANIVIIGTNSAQNFHWKKYFYGSDGLIAIKDKGHHSMELAHWSNSNIQSSESQVGWWQEANEKAILSILDKIYNQKKPLISIKTAVAEIEVMLAAYESHQLKNAIIFR